MKTISKTSQGVMLLEKPIPAITDSKSVLIKITLSALCRTDIFAAQNQIPVSEGVTLGHEFTGVVERVGDEVDKTLLGCRVGVMPVYFDEDKYAMLGIDRDGAYAEYITVPVSNVYPIPESLSIEEAAFLEPIAASLAVLHADIYPSQKGLILGNNRIAELTRRILAIKEFNTVDVLGEEDISKKHNCYDFIIETIPSEAVLHQIVQLIKPKGTIVLKSRPYVSVPMPLKAIVTKEVKLVGAHYGSFQEGIDLLASSQLKVKDIFGPTYSFADAILILSGEKKVQETNKIFFKP